MDGSVELRQIAHLFRLVADTARDIALIRQRDASALERLADEAVSMATKLDAIADPSVKPSVGPI